MKLIISKFIKFFVRINRNLSKKLDKMLPKFFGRTKSHHSDLKLKIQSIINERPGIKVLELGGVNRPLLIKDTSFHYTGLDIEWHPDCENLYDEFIVQSVEDEFQDKYDLIISNTLFEHVEDNTKSFRVMFNALNENGIILHHIPSKNHFYSIITRNISPELQKLLIKYLRPKASATTGYKTYFNMCSPSEMENLCSTVGFSNVQVDPYYRATDYFAFFLPVYILVGILENLFEKLNWRFFACGMNVYAVKINSNETKLYENR